MRLLFFVEPFPVRGRPEDFHWVLERWCALIEPLRRAGAEPVFAVSDVLKALAGGLTRGAAVWSPKDFGLDFTLPADPAQQDASWVSVMKDPDEPSWSPFVEQLLDRSRPDAVVTWTVNAPVRAGCARRGIPVMHQELAPVRFDWGSLYFCDPLGVNGESALPRLWGELRELPLTEAQERDLDRMLAELLPVPPPAPEDLRQRLALDPSKRILAVFLQVPRDSNLLAWSHLKGNDGLARLVTAAADFRRHEVLVKPHPLDATPRPELDPRVRWVSPELPSRSVVRLADAVFTINSSVGLEALAQLKPVYAFGLSPFAGLGLTRAPAPTVEALREALEREPFALGADLVPQLRRFLHFVLFRYLASDAELSDPDALIAKMSRWRALAAAGAPLLDYFPTQLDSSLVRWRDLRRQQAAHLLRRALGEEAARAAQLSERLSELEHERRGLEDALRQANALRDAALQSEASARGELEQLRASRGVRMLEALKRLPGVYPAYLRMKRGWSDDSAWT